MKTQECGWGFQLSAAAFAAKQHLWGRLLWHWVTADRPLSWCLWAERSEKISLFTCLRSRLAPDNYFLGFDLGLCQFSDTFGHEGWFGLADPMLKSSQISSPEIYCISYESIPCPGVDFCYDKPEWININLFFQLLSLKFREQHTLQMVPTACGRFLLHLLPSAKSQSWPSSAAPGPAAGGALMPAAGFPWPGRRCYKPPVGFAFHFPSALGCVTKPLDSSPLTRMFYNTTDQIQTTDMPFNWENNRADGPPSQLRPGAQESKALFFFTKMWNGKGNNLVRSSCFAPTLWVLCNLGLTLIFWPVCSFWADSSNTQTSAVLDFPEPQCHKKLWVCFLLISISSVSLLVLQLRHNSTMIQEDNLKIEWYTHVLCLLTRNTTPPNGHQNFMPRKMKTMTRNLNKAKQLMSVAVCSHMMIRP